MEPRPPTILIVEDHDATRRFLADNLAADGYEPVEAESARDGLRLMVSKAPDLAVVDLGLPDRDGLELLRELRTHGDDMGELDSHLPVLILSGRATEVDRIRGFERGGDDYLAKPFSYGELRERIAALLRRSSMRSAVGRVRVGALEIDPLSREVWVEGERVPLSKRSSRSCGRSRQRRRARSRGRSCCARSGDFGRWARRARWTRTPRGCAGSWPCGGRCS